MAKVFYSLENDVGNLIFKFLGELLDAILKVAGMKSPVDLTRRKQQRPCT